MDESPFNPDELAAQASAGGGPRGGGGIRDFMPEQHRQFFAQLPYLFVGAIDAAGWPLATLLTGPPGFVQSPDPVTLHIAALPDAERSRGGGAGCGIAKSAFWASISRRGGATAPMAASSAATRTASA